MLREGLTFFASSLSSLFFPPVCPFCNSNMPKADSSLCSACRESIEFISPPVCFQCGLPVTGLGNGPAELCGRCLIDPPRYSRARYGIFYQGEVRAALVRFKYYGALHAAKGFSEILVETFRRNFEPREFSLIVPIPIHRKRLVQRGFNQTVVIAENLSAATGIPLDRASLRKIKDTQPQVGLPRPERIKNLRGSFGVSRPSRIRNARVLIVDDVATTGSTIREAAKTITRAEATSVDALVLALRAEPGSVPPSGIPQTQAE